MPTLKIGNVDIGPKSPLTIIAGPCTLESFELGIEIGSHLKEICSQLNLSFIFKASFDKANRTSLNGPRGPGLTQGISQLSQIREKLNVPITTDIHLPQQAELVGAHVDLLQIPAFLCRQTDLLLSAAATKKPINVKKGQFISPAEMTHVTDKLKKSNANGIMVTERGTFFGYHRLVNDFVGLGELLQQDIPVCFDASHSVQEPGGGKNSSGGRKEYIPLLARSAVAAGVHAIFIETHPNPELASSDGPSMLPLNEVKPLLETLKHIENATKNCITPS